MSKTFARCILVLLGLAILLAMMPEQNQLQPGTCIYEAIYFGPPENYLAVGWTHPPCSHEFSRINELQHLQMKHSKITTVCGKAAIYSHPQLIAPMADTFPQLCAQQLLFNSIAGDKNGQDN